MTIVVLGGGITADEKLPLQAKKRLNEAIRLFNEKKANRFLVCGKYSFLFEDSEIPKTTEAKLMKEYLLNEGISEDIIFTEEKSMDTISNAYFAKTEYFIPEKENVGVIVTSDYHINRVKYIFDKFFGKGFSLQYFGINTGFDAKIVERQKELLEEFKELTAEMDFGNHRFFDDKFFNIEYYKKNRDSWIKKITTQGQYD